MRGAQTRCAGWQIANSWKSYVPKRGLDVFATTGDLGGVLDEG